MLWFLVSVSGACALQPGAASPLPGLAQYAGDEVRAVEFAGNLLLPADSLRVVVATHPTECRVEFFPRSFCLFGLDRYRLDLAELARDLLRIQLYYRDHGFYGTRVVPSVDPLGDDNVHVRFTIAPGDEVILRDLVIEGTEAVVPPDELIGIVPLEVGGRFRRVGFLESADTIRAELRQRGYPYADVLRNYTINIETGIADAQFIAIPGPLVRVDSIRVLGAERLGEGVIRTQVTFGQGDILSISELNRSQRNLYSLEMVNFASVEIAPDSLQLTPDSLQLDADSIGSTVAVRIVEAPQYAVDATIGYGTIDCLRSGASWTNRNFLGGARRLELSGSVSKIGVGEPADWGLEDGICSQLREENEAEVEEFSRKMNYRIAADFQQPQLLGTRNQLGIVLHADRSSELRTYLRESVGGQIALSRGFRDAVISTTLDVERGSTEAPDAVFCVGFDLCDPEDVDELKSERWSNSLSIGTLFDRTTGLAAVTRGYRLFANVGWASSLLGSDDEYVRLLGEGSAYRELRPGWVLAGRVLAGTFLHGSLNPAAGYIPPERRFYAGGPNSVRGYARNALGPRAYVRDLGAEDPDTLASATGGTEIVVVSAELRIPSPVFSEYLRLASFVDAGQVWAPGTRATASTVRVTPGVGLRFVTPVGPIRIDAAYNWYDREPGPLYEVLPDGELRLAETSFTPDGRNFWDRIQFHFAIGQAF